MSTLPENTALTELSKERLLELVQIYAKNIIAIDGTWFQSVESVDGMDAAMFHDVEAWKRYTVSEAKRIKQFLGLPEQAGLEGLAQALPFKSTSAINPFEITFDEGALVFRVLDCRVQTARTRKDMPLHPCKPAGFAEYDGFARTIDERIICECVSCYPEMMDESCSCSWRFTLKNTDD